MKYVWAFFCWAGGCPPVGFCGVPGLQNSSFSFFSIALRLDKHHGSSFAELPVRFRCSRDPRDLAVVFLATQLPGVQNNLLEYIACNIYVYIYKYVYICVYMYKCVCIYTRIYANNLNDPCHYFVIGPSSLFCMDVCGHIINVFPVNSMNKRFLILIMMKRSKNYQSLTTFNKNSWTMSIILGLHGTACLDGENGAILCSGPLFYLCLRTVLDSKNLMSPLAKIISFSVPVLATRS